MYISGINYESMADGVGMRTTLFISGCLHGCSFCHSPDTHNFFAGTEVTPELVEQINSEIKKRPFLRGITLSGGDCMYSPAETLKLVRSLEIPHNNIWCYTGFTVEELIRNGGAQLELLKAVDVLVDGPYIHRLRNVSLPFRGSSNQRIIDVPETLKLGHVVEIQIE